MQYAVGLFWQDKYFLSFRKTNSSTKNDCVYVFDAEKRSWHPYTKDWGFDSACEASGTGDIGEVLIGMNDGFINQMEIEDQYSDNGQGYVFEYETRFDGGADTNAYKQFWVMDAETDTTRLIAQVVTDQGRTSTHILEESSGSTWIGGWIGGWIGRETVIQPSSKLAQGMRGKYAQIKFTEDTTFNPWLGGWIGGWTSTGEIITPAGVISASLIYGVEEIT